MIKRVRPMNKHEALSEFRYFMRRFLARSTKTSRSVGLSQKQYLLLLNVYGLLHSGLPKDRHPNIKVLAERLQAPHNSTVELVKRMSSKGLVRKMRMTSDERRVLVLLTPKGERTLHKVLDAGIAEIKMYGPDLIKSLRAVIKHSNI